jgi:thioredoxin 2
VSEGNHVVCPHCDSVNRIPSQKNAAEATCGRCRQKLFDGHPAEVSDASLMKQIERSDIPVVVDFWAEWCSPCRTMAPNYATAAAELEPKIRFLKVDVDRHKQSAAKFGVQGIPALYVFRRGEIVASQAGSMAAGALKTWIVEATRAQ